MKTATLTFALCVVLCSGAPAQEFGAVRYLGHFTPPTGGSYTAGCWGWTDTTSGREYALLGNSGGTSIVEITNVGSMVERDFIPGPSSSWREIQVYKHYAYVVTEGGGGTQIIDLSGLPASASLVKSFTYTSGLKNTGAAHTVHIMDGYMYLNGCAAWSPGGILIFDLADPENPVYKGEFAGNYVHDCYVRNNTIYGAGIYGQGINIIDATVKTAPTLIRNISYPGAGTHNTATTTDGGYVLSTDEIGSTAKTLKIWDLATDAMVAEYVGSPTAIVHNVFVKDSLAIMSYYTAGIRVVDISNPAAPVEIGGYDTYLANDASGYTGAWSVYPYFPSGKIIIGDMASGMYVVEVNADAPLPPSPFSAYSDYSSPTGISLSWADPTQKADGSPLTNFKLHIYRGITWIAEVDSGIETFVDAGLNNHWEYAYSIRAVTPTDSSNVSSTSAWAGGHPQPKPATSFGVSEDFTGNILQWVNPSRQLDDTPLNDLAWVLVYRDGALFDSVAQSTADTGQIRTWNDTAKGFRSYFIRVRDNETPVHYSATSATASGFGGLFANFLETFDSAMIPYQVTGGWDTTSAIAAGGIHSLTDSPGGTYPPGSNRSITFPRVVLGADPILRFEHIAIVAFGDIAFLEISRNNRQTWSTLKVYNQVGHSAWTDGTADPGDWELQLFDLGAYAGDSVNVRFRLSTNPSTNLDGWYVDELYIGSFNEPDTVERVSAGGWNLVSLPVISPDAGTGTLFPAALTPAYEYANGYYSEDTLANGKGYWIKLAPDDTLAYGGFSILRDTIDVAEGWNLIGSVSVPIATSTILAIPPGSVTSQYYAYTEGYDAVATIEPGAGYWVKSSQNAKIVISGFLQSLPAASSPAALPQGDIRERASATDAGNLTFTDADGRRRTLELRTRITDAVSLAAFDLPPLPPAGAFDIRFGSQRSAALLGGAGTMDAIETEGVRYPLTIEWRMPGKATATLAAGSATHRLSGNGSVILDGDPGLLTFSHGGSDGQVLPSAYSLGRSYPNPFNPSTTLEFGLPEPGVVSIEIYNTLGQLVASLADGSFPAGTHHAIWNTSAGRDLPGGVYHARMVVRGASGDELFRDSEKLLLLR